MKTLGILGCGEFQRRWVCLQRRKGNVFGVFSILYGILVSPYQ